MGKQNVYDTDFFAQLDDGLRIGEDGEPLELDLKGQKNLTSRLAMGAVIGYYKLNIGSMRALAFWEYYMCKDAQDLHA